MKLIHGAIAAFAAFSLAPRAQAVEVTFTVASVTTEACHLEYDGYYGDYLVCDPPVAATLSPTAPQGSGSTLDFDVAGELIRGALNLEARTVNGIAMPAWSGAIERETATTVRLANQATGPWPLEFPAQVNPAVPATDFRLTRFGSQTDFSGTLTLRAQAEDLTQWTVQLAFASIPGSGAPACAGVFLVADDDRDGEINIRDANPNSSDTSSGAGIDENGRTVAEICGVLPPSSFPCNNVDFRNDEPQRRKPGDCRVVGFGNSRSCRPAEFYGPASLPAPRTCVGYAVVDDADGDSEPDRTDRCASTPSGAPVDGSGCSPAQFCSAQSVDVCKRSDYRNDEPGVRNPRDCGKTRTRPRACGLFGTP